MSRHLPTIILGKTVQKLSRLKGNGGSALPGLVVERANPQFITNILSKLKYGVVVISGTNGKTTTTKVVAELLQQQGLRVFTNPTGSNFVRGVISAILQHIRLSGNFPFDIAVLELDEAHAVKFAEIVPIRYSLLLNVQRDQLDRFGEIDHTAELLNQVAQKTQKTVVVNREDTRLNQITAKQVLYFGLADNLRKTFPSDDNLLQNTQPAPNTKLPNAKVILDHIHQQSATYEIDHKTYHAKLQLKGIYNAYNVAGALTLVLAILPKTKPDELIEQLSNIESAFGRGETFQIDGQSIELLLVKNPAAFQLSLNSFVDRDHDYLIAINDQIADGRDISWLWNVDFSKLNSVNAVSGSRAYDMALRLKYDEVPVKTIDPDLATAIPKFLKSSKRPKRIFATYTAMLAIRKLLTGRSIS